MDKSLVKNVIITEKTIVLAKLGKYVFLVANNTTASEAKKIIEKEYSVKVIGTNTINTKPKKRRIGNNLSMKPGYKKIIMTLKKGQKLDILPQ